MTKRFVCPLQVFFVGRILNSSLHYIPPTPENKTRLFFMTIYTFLNKKPKCFSSSQTNIKLYKIHKDRQDIQDERHYKKTSHTNRKKKKDGLNTQKDIIVIYRIALQTAIRENKKNKNKFCKTRGAEGPG